MLPAARLETRLRFIDAARGATMLAVFVSHFGLAYFSEGDRRATILTTLTLIASPTFMLLTGLLVGFLYRAQPASFPRLRIILLDRALFLLTIGHALLLAGCWAQMGSARYLLITDAIGISMLVVPTLVQHTSPLQRLTIAAVLYGVSWAGALWWHPASPWAASAIRLLLGAFHSPGTVMSFPLLPWCCLDLVGSAIGEPLAELFVRGDERTMARLLTGIGFAAIAMALMLKGLFVYWHQAAQGTGWQALFAPDGVIRALTSPGNKFPPSPAYFLFYGGLGLCWIALWRAAERRPWFDRVARYAVPMGQTSLFVFILQFYVYFTAFRLLRGHLPLPGAWPLYLALSAAFIVAAALEFHRRDYRRFFTIGIRPWYERRERRRRATGTPLPLLPRDVSAMS